MLHSAHFINFSLKFIDWMMNMGSDNECEWKNNQFFCAISHSTLSFEQLFGSFCLNKKQNCCNFCSGNIKYYISFTYITNNSHTHTQFIISNICIHDTFTDIDNSMYIYIHHVLVCHRLHLIKNITNNYGCSIAEYGCLIFIFRKSR